MYLLYHRRTHRTGRQLGELLGWPFGRTSINSGSESILRWGSSQYPELDSRRVINKASAINLAGDKLRTLTRLKENGIAVPEFQTDQPAMTEGCWLGRNRRGFGGRDIIVRDGVDISPGFGLCEFYTKYIPNNREYRIHVVQGDVIRLQRKYLEHPEMRSNEYVCSHSNGYVFKRPERDLNQSRYDAATQAVEILELDFGAVDMIIDRNGDHYILEVNTAPGCSPMTLEAYATAFRELI